MTDDEINKTDADGDRSAMTDEQQSPDPIAELSYQKRTVVLFDDGAVVTLGDGNWWCSEHTGSPSAPPREECDHSAETTSTVPSFAGEMFVGAAATDRAVQDEVVSRLLENDPERLSGFAEEI